MVWAAYIYVCLVGGTAFLAIRLGIDAGLPPFWSAGVRFFIAGFILLLYLWSQGSYRTLTPKQTRTLILVGLFTTGLRFAALYRAQQVIPSGQASLLAATFPLLVIILHALDQRSVPPLYQWLGILGGFAGVALLLQAPLDVSAAYRSGSLLVLAGELMNAAGTILARRLLSEHVPPLQLNGVQMMVGSAGLLLAAAWTESFPSLAVWQAGLASVLFLSLAGSLLGTTLFYWLVGRIGPVVPSTWSYVAPVIALFSGYLILQETFTRVQLAGALLILLCVILATAGPRLLTRRA
jgi:drug/metabolite transporter (DMT)-like permease